MKNYCALLFFLISSISFSQSASTSTITVSKANITKAETIYNLIPDFQKDCEIISFELVGMVSGKVISIKGAKDDAFGQLKKLLKSADVGKKVYFDAKLKQKDEKIKSYTRCFNVNE